MKFSSIKETATLNNGVKMPWFGLGVFQVRDGKEVETSIKYALECGYRSIDTASLYGNEIGVGNAVRDSEIPREELFITSKVWNSDQGYNSTLNAFEESMEKLQLEYLDLYLIHWPVKGKYLDTWKALEKLYHDGRIRAIGVSNFMIEHLKNLLNSCETTPTINQIEFHPYLVQPDLLKFCFDNNIQPEAWSPLMMGNAVRVSELTNIGKKHDKTPVQIVLRWDLQKNVITIPKSVHKDRIEQNAQIFDFELCAEEMKLIDSLDRNRRFGADPYNFNF